MIFDLALLYLTRKTSCLRLLPSKCAARCQPIPDSELHIQLRVFISSAGTRIVVKGGSGCGANSRSSNQVMESSSGTFVLRDRHSARTPNTRTSDPQITALIGSPDRSSWRSPSLPASMLYCFSQNSPLRLLNPFLRSGNKQEPERVLNYEVIK
jgi:hypothetical protein